MVNTLILGADGDLSIYGKQDFRECLDETLVMPQVIVLICSIITAGATIHYEGGTGSAERRSSVFKNAAGVVIVEERQDGQNDVFYSIVTAFQAHKVNGPVIGAILKRLLGSR